MSCYKVVLVLVLRMYEALYHYRLITNLAGYTKSYDGVICKECDEMPNVSRGQW